MNGGNFLLGNECNKDRKGDMIARSIICDESRVVKSNKQIKDWLTNTSRSFFQHTAEHSCSIYRYQMSPQSSDEKVVTGDIVLIQQYYIDGNAQRHAENKKCLFYNSHNDAITKIILLNERIYSDEELGVKSNKIVQVVTGRRLTYKDAMEYVD